MIETFTPKNFQRASRVIIDQANAICADYQAQGYNLTLRQVYYQFVARDLLPNKAESYKKLGNIINDARLAGAMDWNYIQDRTREIRGGFGGYANPGQFLSSVANSYIERIWKDQDYRPEVWVEKDALVDVVGQACGQTRTPYFSCRGYVSQSEMYEAAKRFERRRDQGLTPVIIHLGDHDPSGMDMTRDIRDRLRLMSWGDVEVVRIALNMDQIDQYQPPPNPAKLTDSRAVDYIQEYGSESWELDALEPQVLDSLIQNTLDQYIDSDVMQDKLNHEAENEERLHELARNWDGIDSNWDSVIDLIGGTA